MTYRVAVHGFGRIGRAYLRCLRQRGVLGGRIELAAVSDHADPGTLVRLLAFDSTFGRLDAPVSRVGAGIDLGGYRIPVLHQPDPTLLPWDDLGVDLVVAAVAADAGRDDAAAHVKAGARRVLVTAPLPHADATLVVGVNEHSYDPVRHEVVSAASPTAACAAPMAAVLHRAFGIAHGQLTAVRAYAEDQALLDRPHPDPRLARGAAVNIVPTGSGAAQAVGQVLPELAGRLDGAALRVPVPDGSLCDLVCQMEVPVTAHEVNAAFLAAAGRMRGVLRCTDAPVVSRDIVGDPASCVLDTGLTRAAGELVRVAGWYDNEWAYASRLVDLTLLFARS